MILKTAVGSGKLMQPFEPESFPTEEPFTNWGMCSSVGTNSNSKSRITLPLPTAVFRIIWILIFCTGIALSAEETSLCFFSPPEGWEVVDPTTLSSRVKIAFVKPKAHGFFPSMNLSVEKTSVSLNEYLKAVKAIHEQDRNNHWRALGKVHTTAGLAQLTEIDTSSDWGPVRMLQLILLKEGHAYVLTAAALKKEFSKFYKEIQTAFRSLTLTTDLLSCIPLLEKQEGLKQKQKNLIEVAQEENFQEKYWPAFQQEVLTQFADMGTYWQVLLLKQTQEEIVQICRNNLKNREFGKEAPQNFQAPAVQSEQALPSRQGASEHENFEVEPTMPKTDSSGCFGIRTRPLNLPQ